MAGNGFAIIIDIDANYCRVAQLGRDEVAKEVYLAHKDLLTIGQPIEPQLLSKVDDMRKGLKTGKLKLVGHIVRPASWKA